MKILSASILLLLSVYLLAFPAWIVQVFGATVASLGFILSASILFGEKHKRNPQWMGNQNIEDEIDYGDYRAEIDATHSQFDTWQQTDALDCSEA